MTALLEWGAGNGPARREPLRAELAAITRATTDALAGFDALLLPATPHAAFAFDAPIPPDQSIFATLGSCLGYPATVFPTGEAAGGLPLAAQIVAADDASCLAYAAEPARG